MPRPTIAVLYVGGSIGMIRSRKTGRIEPIESLAEIHRFIPEAQSEASLEFHSIANVGSSDITPHHWVEIAIKISKLEKRVEGFVVIHGTNTMAYTAAALSFALQNLSKPIVLTGALLPIGDAGSDARMNLAFAIQAAQLDLAEVCVVLGPKVLRGTRCKKADQSILETFDSPKFPSLAEFNLSTSLHPWRIVRRKRTLECFPSFDPNVVSITLHPGMPEAYFEALLAAKPHGIVLRAYGLGMLPEHLFPWIRRVSKKGIPIVITSQLLRGSIDLHLYMKQLVLEELGVISGKDMTYECAVTKLMWALAQTKNPRRLRELMERNLVGELTET
ncbi:asparaginase [Candidatus Peribacteria bacterium]|nr:asparaginase [Candidatus Peribacteria bacterium]